MWIKRDKVEFLKKRIEFQQQIISSLRDRLERVEKSRDLALNQVRLANAEATRLAEVVRNLQKRAINTQSDTSEGLPIDN